MTREEAKKILKAISVYECYPKSASEETKEAIDMAIEALSAEYEDYEHATLVDIKEPLKVSVVRCKDCRHAGECHKSVQYTRNEPNTVTIGYSPIEWCSRGERREE